MDEESDTAKKLQRIGGKLTLWVTLPIVILLVVAYCID